MNMTKFMLNILKNHRIYESFTCKDNGMRLKDDLLAKVSPVGLLSDIAVNETELTAEERALAFEAFSAYCLYHGAKILGKKNPDDVVNYNLVLAAVKCAKKCHENGTYDGFHKLFSNLVNWRYTDTQRKNGIKIKDQGASAQGKTVYTWQTRTTSMEYENQEDRSTGMNPKVQECIAEISLEKASKAENIKLVREVLSTCIKAGRLTHEQIDMLCHYYGIGKNYEMMNQTAIAKKLGVSPAYVCNKLMSAYAVMHDFIGDDRSAA